jgi:predicted NBD/HSP70 family sugar kinase
MTRYIGLDVHASNCTLAVVTETGKRSSWEVVETTPAALIDAVKRLTSHKADENLPWRRQVPSHPKYPGCRGHPRDRTP